MSGVGVIATANFPAARAASAVFFRASFKTGVSINVEEMLIPSPTLKSSGPNISAVNSVGFGDGMGIFDRLRRLQLGDEKRFALEVVIA